MLWLDVTLQSGERELKDLFQLILFLLQKLCKIPVFGKIMFSLHPSSDIEKIKSTMPIAVKFYFCNWGWSQFHLFTETKLILFHISSKEASSSVKLHTSNLLSTENTFYRKAKTGVRLLGCGQGTRKMSKIFLLMKLI